MSAKKNYTIVSADTHAGADLWDYKKYLPSNWHEEFDEWAKAYASPWDDLSTTQPPETGTVNFAAPTWKRMASSVR